jgi:hypothetical protein
MRKLILAGFASLFAFSAHAAPSGKWSLVFKDHQRSTYIDNSTGINSDSTIIHNDVLIWFDWGKEKVEIVSYDVDCTKGFMRKTASKVWNDLSKSWPESPYALTPNVGKWLHPYDQSLTEVYNLVCIGGE